MKKVKKVLGWMTVLAILGIFHFGLAEVQAASPSGELKGAIHWAISADWLDPATTTWSLSGFLPLYLLHDALLKPMPEGLLYPLSG